MNVVNAKWVFQNSVTKPGDGNVYLTGRNDVITIFITGDSTSRLVEFFGKDEDDNWYPIPAYKLPNYTPAVKTTGNNEAWMILTINFVAVKAKVSSVDGGTVRIIGKIVENNNSIYPLPYSFNLDDNNDPVLRVGVDAGTNIIGQVGIDQTTDGTTNKIFATQTTHDNLNLNANLQIGDTDVGSGNQVPVYDATLEALVGEVQENPTANTILDRLKTIADNTSDIEITADTINLSTDGLETLLTELKALVGEVQESPTSNTLLDRLKLLENKIDAVKDTDGIKKITDALPAGTNLIGKFGIDQATANANEVVVKSSIPMGSSYVGSSSVQTTVGANTELVGATPFKKLSFINTTACSISINSSGWIYLAEYMGFSSDYSDPVITSFQIKEIGISYYWMATI